MKNIQILKMEKYADAARYESAEVGIYKDLKDADRTNHRLAISFELEEGEDTQYPLEDILDKYRIHVTEFIKEEGSLIELELAGKLENLHMAADIIGKRVYNKDVVEDGKTYVSLVIE